jgi:hypothetical protein
LPIARRAACFLKGSAAIVGVAVLETLASLAYSDETKMNVVGPKKGYSPQLGTLVSMMAFMRAQVLSSVKGMSVKDLDFLFDEKANRIGAMLLHLVEKF